jgi:NAD(P)H-flavin reductase
MTFRADAAADAASWVGAPRRYQLGDRREETPDTVTLRLDPLDPPVPAARPGQYMMLTAYGVGEVPVAVSGPTAGDPATLRHTLRGRGAVTRALWALSPGGAIGVRGPFGPGWPEPEPGMDLLVVASGLGLAALRPVVYRAFADRDRYRDIVVVAAARKPADLLYLEELAVWSASGMAQVEIVANRPEDSWPGPVGPLTGPLAEIALDPAATVAYVCCSRPMTWLCARELTGRGVPAGRVWVSLGHDVRSWDEGRLLLVVKEPRR